MSAKYLTGSINSDRPVPLTSMTLNVTTNISLVYCGLITPIFIVTLMRSNNLGQALLLIKEGT